MLITTYSQRAFEKMVRNKEYLPGSYFISITHYNSDFETYIAPPGEKFLRLKFDDVIEKVLGSIPFSEKNCNEIVDFLKDINKENIYIHCAAGQSRSVGIAEALKEYYDCEVKHTSENINPNSLVYKMVKNKLQDKLGK